MISISLVPTWGFRPGPETLVKDLTVMLEGVSACVRWEGNNYKGSIITH